MTKEELDLAKQYVAELMDKNKDLELASVKTKDDKELTYESLEVGKEVKIGEDIAPDGDYELEDGRMIVIKDGVIAEIKEVEAKEDAPVVEAAEEAPADTEVPEEVDINVDALKTVLAEGITKDGTYAVMLTVTDGVYSWGTVLDNDLEMSAHKEVDNKVIELEAQVKDQLERIEKQDNAIVELSKANTSNSFVDGPDFKVEEDIKPMTRGEMMAASYSKQAK